MIKKKQVYLFLASSLSMTTVLLIASILFKYRTIVHLSSLLWLAGFVVSLMIFVVAIAFAYHAWKYGRKKKTLRFR